MKLATAITVIGLSVLAFGQVVPAPKPQPQSESVTVKGHALGESIPEFIKSDPQIRVLVIECKDGPRVLSVEEVRKAFPPASKKKIQAAERGELRESGEDYSVRCESAIKLGRAIAGNTPVTVSTGARFRDFMSAQELAGLGGGRSAWMARWSFADGKLTRIEFDSLSSYAEVRDDLTGKLGINPTEISIPYQNGFGARWSDPVADWITDKYHAVLTEGRDPVHPTWATLILQPRVDYDKEAATRKAVHPLDKENSSGPNPVPGAAPALPETLKQAIVANSAAAKASPAAAASLANVGHVLSPQELEELVQKGQASKCAVVTVPPGADVEVDGNRAGVSPLVFVLLKRGETPRTITLKKDGYKTVEKKVVPDGKTIPIGLTMEKQ